MAYALSWTKIRCMILCLLLALVSPAMRAQELLTQTPEAERMFADGLSLFDKGAYKEAARVFGDVLLMFPQSHRETAARVMKGKALLYAREYDEAQRTLNDFIRQFPSSTYRPDAEYSLGLIALAQHLPERAAEHFLNALRSTSNDNITLRRRVLAALDSTIDVGMTLPPLYRLLAEEPEGEGREYLFIKVGEKHIARGDVAGASAVIDSLRRNYPATTFAERRSQLQRRLLEPPELKIGLLLPLMKHAAQATKEREVGVALQEGIQLAYEELLARGNSTRRVHIEARDIEREASVAVAAVKELCADPGVIGIIGPPFTQTAFAVAYHVNTNGVPLVTPTANANGIAATGPFVFQANPDFEARARAVARYAVETLGLKRIGILAPNEMNSKLMADAFKTEAERLGAAVLAVEWYEPGATNLMNQLLALRRKGNAIAGEPFLAFGTSITKREAARLAQLGVPGKLLDSLIAVKAMVNATRLLGENARAVLDAEAIPYRSGDPRIDSLDRPVTAFQGLYCPIASAEEIGIVSSQVAYFNVQTRLLGSGEWNNERELAAHRRYCSGIVFESDTYLDPADPAYAAFVRRYIERFGKRPSRNAVFGYDVASVVFGLIEKGALSRAQLQEALASLPTRQTIHAKLSFGSRRVNPWLHILEYTGSTIRRVDELQTEEP